MQKDNIYNCDDNSLGDMLHRLFIIDGNAEVEIHDPVKGPVVITRKDYDTQMRLQNQPAKKLSPAKRIEKGKQLKHIKNQKLIRFRTSMIDAPIFTVDTEDDANFGKDIEGKQLDIEGKIFLLVKDYPKGIEPYKDEIGCFLQEYDKKSIPIRIKECRKGEDAAN